MKQRVWVGRALLVVLVALAALGIRAGNAPAQDADALDVPAMALFPDDAAAAGLDEYQIAVGNLPLVESQAIWLSVHTKSDITDVEESLAGAGVEQIYELFLDRPADATAQEGALLGSIVSAVYVGDDEQGAEELFDLMADGWAGVAQEKVAASTVGDASVLTFHEGTEPYILTDATWLHLTILAGADVLSVSLVDYNGETPDADAAIELGKRLVERVADARAGDAPRLAALAVQLVPDDDVAYPGGSYLQIDGESLPVVEAVPGLGKYLETTIDNVDRAEFYKEIGAADVYFTQQQLRGGRVGGPQDYYLEVVVIRFTDAAAAEDYMVDVPDLLAGDRAIKELEEADEVPSDGDEALAFSYQAELYDRGPFYHQPTYIRDGEIIARVTIIGVEPTEEGAALVAEAQAECLLKRDCTEPIATPENLREE